MDNTYNILSPAIVITMLSVENKGSQDTFRGHSLGGSCSDATCLFQCHIDQGTETGSARPVKAFCG